MNTPHRTRPTAGSGRKSPKLSEVCQNVSPTRARSTPSLWTSIRSPMFAAVWQVDQQHAAEQFKIDPASMIDAGSMALVTAAGSSDSAL